jgi:hypothetical protein
MVGTYHQTREEKQYYDKWRAHAARYDRIKTLEECIAREQRELAVTRKEAEHLEATDPVIKEWKAHKAEQSLMNTNPSLYWEWYNNSLSPAEKELTELRASDRGKYYPKKLVELESIIAAEKKQKQEQQPQKKKDEQKKKKSCHYNQNYSISNKIISDCPSTKICSYLTL